MEGHFLGPWLVSLKGDSMKPANNAIQELTRLADQLEAIAYWQMDHVSSNTPTSTLLLESSKWLRECSRNVCGQGIFGCGFGENCDGDHK